MNFRYGVRPAFRINLQSEIIKSLITGNQKNESIIVNPLLVIKNGTVIIASRQAERIVLPSYVKKIASDAFRDCEDLTEISWTGKMPVIEEGAFYNCPKLILPAEFYLGSKFPSKDFDKFMPGIPEVMANVLLTAPKTSTYRETVIENLNPDNVILVADELLKRIPLKKTLKDPEVILRFVLASPMLGQERLNSFKKLLNKIGLTGRKCMPIVNRETERTDQCEPVIGKYLFEISSRLLGLDMEELDRLPRLAALVSVTGEYAGQYENGYVEPKEYRREAKEYIKCEKAGTAAKDLNHKALMGLLEKWEKADGPKWYAPYAAFADEKELEELLAEMKTWENDKSLREQIIRVRGAVLLNDTVTAMRYADKMGLLGRYAEMRGMDEDEIRDNTISDFGMDEHGVRTWNLSEKTLTASVNNDLTVTLIDETGKVLKSVPKKGLTAEEYETVRAEFDALKKGIRPTAKTRNDRIFTDFLTGRKREASDWKSAYLKNPVLRIHARLIVWEQNGNTFTLNEAGNAIHADGTEYPLTDEPVAVAHPMEMDQADVEAWQKYFSDHALKQPFEQVWEPVADKDTVKPGRYDGCTIPLYMLMNKEKHGIIMEGQSRITLKGCSAGLRLVEGHHDWYNNDFEITDFRYDEWNQQVNHIVVHLDKGTVAGRVKKDDISVVQWFDRFTLAQITEFINMAAEANASQVLAQLIEYKNTDYSDFNPMDEFTLDL